MVFCYGVSIVLFTIFLDLYWIKEVFRAVYQTCLCTYYVLNFDKCLYISKLILNICLFEEERIVNDPSQPAEVKS